MALKFGHDLDDITGAADVDALLAGDTDAAPTFEADPDPGWEDDAPSLLDKLRGRRAERPAKPSAPVKVTAALRKDVQAKTALLLTMGAGAWQVRDEFCGGAAMAAVPDVSAALADIFCDSPDIVKWFNTGSGYLKWLNLAAAVQPVFGAVWAHHITGAAGGDRDAAGPDWSAYATG